MTRSEESFSARGKTGWAWASLLVSPSLSPYTYLVSLALDCANSFWLLIGDDILVPGPINVLTVDLLLIFFSLWRFSRGTRVKEYEQNIGNCSKQALQTSSKTKKHLKIE